MKIIVTAEEFLAIIRALVLTGYPELAQQLREQDAANDGPEVTILSVDPKS